MKIFVKKKINKNDINNAEKIFNGKIKNHKLKKIFWEYPSSKQFIIYLKKFNTTIGMIRVIKKKIYLSQKFYNVACITTVGIFPDLRNLGYARILMEKSNAYLKKKFNLSLLIARRKVDHFYNKFNFIGNSEFFSIHFKIIKKISNNNFKKKKRNSINNNLIKFYVDTNKKKNGYIQRENSDWKIINKKIFLSKFSINEFQYKNISLGYIVFKKRSIIEYGYNKEFLKFFILAIKIFFEKEVEIKNPDKRIINELKKNDEIYINRRHCTYGGHMINFYNNKELKNINYNINFFDEF